MSDKKYGATAAEWDHFSLMLGLTEDMLPCVADPTAKISPVSTLKSIGKTPSRFDGKGDVVGIAKWTSLRSNEAQINLWRNHGQYSICLQTRRIRAIDIDVSDVALAGRLRASFTQLLGVLPARGRAGSSRVILAFQFEGRDQVVQKQVIRLADDAGIVEFLANGQQFIAAGTHTSGSRYFWEGGLPDDFPVITKERFDHAWGVVAREFGEGLCDPDSAADESVVAGVTDSGEDRGSLCDDGGDQGIGKEPTLHDRPQESGRVATRKRPADPVAVWLKKRGWITGRSSDKVKLFVACPWEDDHTADSGESATAWFLAGTNGYVHGHFECLHAHCTGRTDDQFLQAVGFNQSLIPSFDVVSLSNDLSDSVEKMTPADTWHGDGTPGSGLTRSKKGWNATANNIIRALNTTGFWRKIARDKFRDCIMWSPWEDVGGWRVWLESDYTRARVQLEQNGFEPMGKDLLRDAIRLVAEENAFDAAQDWLNGLVWDGVPRISRFMADMMGAEDGPYSAAIGEYLWTALAGRCLEPGCKADMVPVFIGAQGAGKTSMIEALVPSVDFYGSLDWHDKEDNILRKMRGRMVMEMAELRGLKTKDQDAIKAFITQRYDSWVPKYAELEVTVPRRVLIIGTGNDEEILTDESGARRWLPIKVGQAEIEKIAQIRDQLWSEGAKSFKSDGIKWQDAQRLAVDIHADFSSVDDWEGPIIDFLESNREDDVKQLIKWKNTKFTSRDVLVFGLGFDLRVIHNGHQRRVVKILKTLGYETRVGKDSQRKSYRYFYLSTLSTL